MEIIKKLCFLTTFITIFFNISNALEKTNVLILGCNRFEKSDGWYYDQSKTDNWIDILENSHNSVVYTLNDYGQESENQIKLDWNDEYKLTNFVNYYKNSFDVIINDYCTFDSITDKVLAEFSKTLKLHGKLIYGPLNAKSLYYSVDEDKFFEELETMFNSKDYSYSRYGIAFINTNGTISVSPKIIINNQEKDFIISDLLSKFEVICEKKEYIEKFSVVLQKLYNEKYNFHEFRKFISENGISCNVGIYDESHFMINLAKEILPSNHPLKNAQKEGSWVVIERV